jgi:hypothetical protein
MVDQREELPFLFCEFGPGSRVNCVTRPQNCVFIPIVYIAACMVTGCGSGSRCSSAIDAAAARDARRHAGRGGEQDRAGTSG